MKHDKLNFTGPSRMGLQNTPTAPLQKSKTPPPPPRPECQVYDAKQSDGEVLVILGLLGMQSTSTLPSLLSSHWLSVVALDRVEKPAY